jgi:serine/threonine protein phosphatase PrpC
MVRPCESGPVKNERGERWGRRGEPTIDLDLLVGHESDTGRVRQYNEDYVETFVPANEVLLHRRGSIFVVADGMGGHQAGGVASREAVKEVVQEYYADATHDVGESLRRACGCANERVFELAQADPSKMGMGTTLVAAVILNHRLYVANVGDSRAYLLHRRRFTRITVDHSWVEEQVQAGILSREEAESHPHRNLITRALGTRPAVEVDLFEVDLNEGDALLLCTDGLSGQVSEQDMARHVRDMPPERAAAELVKQANARGGRDNVSVAIVQIGGRQRLGSGGPQKRNPVQRIAQVLQAEGLHLGRRISSRAETLSPSQAVAARLAVAIALCLCLLLAILPLASGGLPGAPAAAPRLAPIRFEGLTENDLSQVASLLGYADLAEMQAAYPGRLDSGDLSVVDLSPAGGGVFLAGLVRNWSCREGTCTFRLKMAGEAYQVEIEQARLASGVSSLYGRRVRVFGLQRAENGAVNARLIDLRARWWCWWQPAWGTVYQDGEPDAAVWVYSIVDRSPYSTIEMEEHPSLKRGEQILARGRWLAGGIESRSGDGGSMTFAVENLYHLQGDVYLQVVEGAPVAPQPTVTLRPTAAQ